MTTLKKKLFTIQIALLLLVPLSANAQKTRVPLSELPSTAQIFITTYFADQTLDYVIKDSETFSFDYTVRFQSGIEIEFDKKGRWSEIEGKPASLTMLPEGITTYLKTNYPNADVLKIDWDREFELKLSNGLELKFDKKGRFLRLDD